MRESHGCSCGSISSTGRWVRGPVPVQGGAAGTGMQSEDSARHDPSVMAPSRSASALSPLLFTDGVLDPGACGDRRTHDVLRAASERAADRLRPGDVLFAALAGRDPAVLPALEAALAEGAAPQHLMEAIDVYDPPGTAYGFDGSPGRIAPELMAAFADFAAEYAVHTDEKT